MSTEKFKGLASQTSLDQQGLDHQSYSQHLGRAEFGELRRNRKTSTSSVQGITSPTLSGGGVNQQQSRDSSNERPASAMARMAASGMDYSIFLDLALRDVYIFNLGTVVWKDKLDLKIVQGIWLGSWSKAPIGQLKFIEN